MYALIRKALFIVPALLMLGITGSAEVPQNTNQNEEIGVRVYFNSGHGGRYRWHRGPYYRHHYYPQYRYYHGYPNYYYYQRHYPHYWRQGGFHFRIR